MIKMEKLLYLNYNIYRILYRKKFQVSYCTSFVTYIDIKKLKFKSGLAVLCLAHLKAVKYKRNLRRATIKMALLQEIF